MSYLPNNTSHNLSQEVYKSAVLSTFRSTAIINYVAALLELQSSIQVPLLCADAALPPSLSSKSVIFLPSLLSSISGEVLTEKHAGYNDPIFYIYTSGTTGRNRKLKANGEPVIDCRITQSCYHQAFSLPICQLLPLLHGTNLWRRYSLLSPANVSFSLSCLSWSDHHWRKHCCHKKEILCHQVLGRLCQEQCHSKLEHFKLPHIFTFLDLFPVWPIYWRDCKIFVLKSHHQVWESTSDQNDVWKWTETSDLGSVCPQVQHQADQWVLWIHRRQL